MDKKIYATVIRNKQRIGDTCIISKDLFNELIEDTKHYIIRQKEHLGDSIVYDILHINDNGVKSIIIISEEV